VARAWQGPIALAVYIPAPADSRTGAQCRISVLDYVRTSLVSSSQQSLAVALQFAAGVVPNLHCAIGVNLTGFEGPNVDAEAFRARFAGADWTAIWRVQYPVNSMRELARSMVRLSCASVQLHSFGPPLQRYVYTRSGR
jgi:nicotinamide mononucleotide (NMN) deamidase PncC